MKHFVELFKFILASILINMAVFNAAFSMQAAKLTAEENARLNARYIKLHKNVKGFVTFSKFQVMSENDRKDAEDRSDYAKSFLSHYMSFEDWSALTTNQRKHRVEDILNRQVDTKDFPAKTLENDIKKICDFIKNRSFPVGFKSYNEYIDFFRSKYHMSPSEYISRLREILHSRGVNVSIKEAKPITVRIGK